MKPLNQLRDELAREHLDKYKFKHPDTAEVSFKSGFSSATVLVFDRIVGTLSDYHSDNGPYRSAQWWADWLTKNKQRILDGELK